MKERKNEKGITLIALVITIIVLLILAGVSIAMLTGENGILSQAQRAKDETEKATLIEQVQTAIMEKQAEKGIANVYRADLKGILDIYFEEVPYNFSLETLLQSKVTYGNYQISVSEIYKGSIEEKILTAIDMTEDQKKELYGSYVTNYECANNDAIEPEQEIPGKWMIFHIDDNNIYLIASEYISSVPDGKNGGKPIVGSNTNYPLGVTINNILNDYQNGTSDVSEIGKKLNNDYFNVKKYTSMNENMKAVAYMLDTNVWSTFKGDDADYAIGGPTIELFLESYNKKYGTNYVAEATSNIGYQMGDGIASSYNLELSKVDDPTYVIISRSNANAMKVASPAANPNNSFASIIGVGYDGNVSRGHHSDDAYGFRPIVSLKANVQLKKTGDNTYQIIN